MHLYLAQKMQALCVEPNYFFRLAHLWKFKREVDVARDALEYRQAGIIPPYVASTYNTYRKARGQMDNDEKPLDQRAREAEQYAFDFKETPQPQPKPPDYEPPRTCNQAGYCYCPKCNPR